MVDLLNENRSGNEDKIRKEKYSPRIYFIVINYDYHEDGSQCIWKFVKVGFTHGNATDSEEHPDTRLDQVKSEILSRLQKGSKSKYWTDPKNLNKVSVLMKPCIKAIDTGNYFEIEKRCRRYFGIKVEHKYEENGEILKLPLPVYTEWVITTQDFITKIMKLDRTDTSLFDKEKNQFNSNKTGIKCKDWDLKTISKMLENLGLKWNKKKYAQSMGSATYKNWKGGTSDN